MGHPWPAEQLAARQSAHEAAPAARAPALPQHAQPAALGGGPAAARCAAATAPTRAARARAHVGATPGMVRSRAGLRGLPVHDVHRGAACPSPFQAGGAWWCEGAWGALLAVWPPCCNCRVRPATLWLPGTPPKPERVVSVQAASPSPGLCTERTQAQAWHGAGPGGCACSRRLSSAASPRAGACVRRRLSAGAARRPPGRGRGVHAGAQCTQPRDACSPAPGAWRRAGARASRPVGPARGLRPPRRRGPRRSWPRRTRRRQWRGGAQRIPAARRRPSSPPPIRRARGSHAGRLKARRRTRRRAVRLTPCRCMQPRPACAQLGRPAPARRARQPCVRPGDLPRSAGGGAPVLGSHRVACVPRRGTHRPVHVERPGLGTPPCGAQPRHRTHAACLPAPRPLHMRQGVHVVTETVRRRHP